MAVTKKQAIPVYELDLTHLDGGKNLRPRVKIEGNWVYASKEACLLLAAAPRMLQVLQKADKALERGDFPDFEMVQEAVALALYDPTQEG